MCHRIAAGGDPAAQIAYWMGLRLRHKLPALAAGPQAEVIPPAFHGLDTLLLEVLDLEEVDIGHLSEVSAKTIYATVTETLPPAKIETKMPDISWSRTWTYLQTAGLLSLAVDVVFSLEHNILPLRARLHRIGVAETAACSHCGAAVEDQLHFFTACPRVAVAWAALATVVGRVLGGPLPDLHLLLLHLPPGQPLLDV
jgi:hypothetical protein